MAIVTADCFLGQTQEQRQLSIYEALLGVITDAGGSTADMVAADCFLGLPPDFRLKAIYEALLGIADAVGGGGVGGSSPFLFAASDEATDITAGTDKITFQWLGADRTLTGVAGFLTTAPAGSSFQFDVMVNGVSILSTKVTIEAGENSSLDATTQPVISSPTLTQGDVVSIDVLNVGSGTAGAGLKVGFLF